MIKELVNFTSSLDESFLLLGSKPKEGIHITLSLKTKDSICSIGTNEYHYEIYSKKKKSEISEYLNLCKLRHQNAWCIDTNKCFDLPTKAIHTCSPYCVAFKREHLKGGGKYIENEKKNKTQIYKRFGAYFEKAFSLFEDKEKALQFHVLKLFFTHNTFTAILEAIETNAEQQRGDILSKIDLLKDDLKTQATTISKEEIKNNILELEHDLLDYKKLEDSDYIVFYLDLPLEEYIKAHKKYLDDKLFNTDRFNTEPNEEGLIYGTSNFLNGFNSSMPFLLHHTASFDICGRISNVEAKTLNDFKSILPNKTLPNPLPIFIYKDELQGKTIGIFKESGFKMTYKEIIEKLLVNHKQELDNYYLLYWANTKDGIVFKDYDFVSKFEYKLYGEIINYFERKEKDGKNLKQYPRITNVFEFEQLVFKQLLQSKNFKLDYFNDLNKDDYGKKELTFISYCKFRKSVYDFVYKSQRQAVDGSMFNEMIFNGIYDDIKQGNGYGVKEKLNIWYSLYNLFNLNNEETMASKLKSYQQFVVDIVSGGIDYDVATEKHFAFVAGQVIYYIMEKSKSADNSYQLLEPYLQKSKCSEFKQAIANDFARYKHENFSRSFERAASFVLSFETDGNIKHLLPELLSGVFAKNQLFSNNPKN